MSEVEVVSGGGDAMLPGPLIGDVGRCLQSFIEELESERRNNNELKERAVKITLAARALEKRVLTLPPQGRILLVKARVAVKSGSMIRPGPSP